MDASCASCAPGLVLRQFGKNAQIIMRGLTRASERDTYRALTAKPRDGPNVALISNSFGIAPCLYRAAASSADREPPPSAARALGSSPEFRCNRPAERRVKPFWPATRAAAFQTFAATIRPARYFRCATARSPFHQRKHRSERIHRVVDNARRRKRSGLLGRVSRDRAGEYGGPSSSPA
jgi:hypothetical protein